MEKIMSRTPIPAITKRRQEPIVSNSRLKTLMFERMIPGIILVMHRRIPTMRTALKRCASVRTISVRYCAVE